MLVVATTKVTRSSSDYNKVISLSGMSNANPFMKQYQLHFLVATETYTQFFSTILQ